MVGCRVWGADAVAAPVHVLKGESHTGYRILMRAASYSIVCDSARVGFFRSGFLDLGRWLWLAHDALEGRATIARRLLD